MINYLSIPKAWTGRGLLPENEQTQKMTKYKSKNYDHINSPDSLREKVMTTNGKYVREKLDSNPLPINT